MFRRTGDWAVDHGDAFNDADGKDGQKHQRNTQILVAGSHCRHASRTGREQAAHKHENISMPAEVVQQKARGELPDLD